LKIKIIPLFFVFLAIYFYGLWELTNQNFSRNFIPKKIEVSFFGLIKEHLFCGAKVFKISNNTLKQINQQGLSFFKDATRTREYDSDGEHYYSNYHYEAWQETPLQESTKNRYFWGGFDCAKDMGLDKELSEKIAVAANNKGSYYTGHYEGQLLVIPSLGIVVYAYMD
jgi:hypothetical protein